MASLAGVLLVTAIITPSGALSPGPLSVSAMVLGARDGWKAGVLIAVGHMAFELPYFMLLVFFTRSVGISGPMEKAMLIAASIFVLFFAYIVLRDAWRGAEVSFENMSFSSGRVVSNPFLVGLLLTGLNPYFLVWWVSVGLPIVEGASGLGASGAAVYVLHVSYDYAWLALLAYLASLGAKRFGGTMYRVFLALLGVVLVLFAVDMLLKALGGKGLLPI